MTSSEAIARVLKEQISGYKKLYALLQKERECLIDFKADCIEKLSKEKDTVILGLNLLEDERIRLVRKSFGRDIKLREISAITGDLSLLELRSSLLSLAQAIGEMNEFNRVLMDRSLNHVRNTVNFFGGHGLCSGLKDKGSLVSAEI